MCKLLGLLRLSLTHQHSWRCFSVHSSHQNLSVEQLPKWINPVQIPSVQSSLSVIGRREGEVMDTFNTLHLASEYWQVQMVEDAREKTAFTTHTKLYEPWVMPIGLCNVPATFRRLIETVLAGLTRSKGLGIPE